MYSKENYIASVEREINIIKHLVSKVNAEHHSHKFTEKQRTIHELVAYLAYSPRKWVKLIFNGDMWVFADSQKLQDEFKMESFNATIDNSRNEVKTMILNADHDSLNEVITLFGMMNAKRSQLLIDFVLLQIAAYKMQLFLQLKHAWLTELVTSNLRMWVDSPAKH